jgi:hypothetical protein
MGPVSSINAGYQLRAHGLVLYQQGADRLLHRRAVPVGFCIASRSPPGRPSVAVSSSTSSWTLQRNGLIPGRTLERGPLTR